MIEKILEDMIELPEIQKGKGMWQNRFHKYDVFEHTMKYIEYIKEMSEDENMIVAGLLHDIGKPVVAKETTINEEGKQYHTFPNHEEIGYRMVLEMEKGIFQDYGLNQEKIALLVKHHYTPMKRIIEMRKSETLEEFTKTYNELEKQLDETGLERKEIMEMFLADTLAKGGPTDQPELVKVYEFMIKQKGSLEEIHELQKITYKK